MHWSATETKMTPKDRLPTWITVYDRYQGRFDEGAYA